MDTPDHRLTQTCTLTWREVGAASATDAYGNPIPTETTGTSPCWAEPSGRADERAETAGIATIQTESLTLYLPAGTRLDGLTAVDIEGKRYEAIGPASRHFNPRLGRHIYVTATIRRAA